MENILIKISDHTACNAFVIFLHALIAFTKISAQEAIRNILKEVGIITQVLCLKEGNLTGMLLFLNFAYLLVPQSCVEVDTFLLHQYP